jgi:alpha-galactosidase
MIFQILLDTTLLMFATLAVSRADDIPYLEFHRWALTPPMGWNSWDCFGTQVTEQQTKENADYMAANLAKHGWQYIVVDIQWYEPTSKGFQYKAGAPLFMDDHGRLLPATTKFPSAANGNGFTPLADYVHGKGLKFGIHLLRGVPRQAVEKKTPILGTQHTADQIANKDDGCPWNPDMWGVDMTKPGAQEYYDSVFALIASWGVDFVKVDDLSRPYHKAEIEAMRKAIDKTGRPMVLSTSPGETPLADAEHVASHANMWRMSDDFWDSWKALHEQFARCRNWAKFTGPGHFPDADMLPLGNIRATEPNGWTHFTHDEQYTMMTLWAISRSPLIMGGNMPKNDRFTLSLMTNDDVIAVDQHSVGGRQLFAKDDCIAWVADIPDSKDKYLAVFNIKDDPTEDQSRTSLPVEVPLADLGFTGAVEARDLWRQESAGTHRGTFAPRVPFHGAGLYRLSALPQ